MYQRTSHGKDMSTIHFLPPEDHHSQLLAQVISPELSGDRRWAEGSPAQKDRLREAWLFAQKHGGSLDEWLEILQE